MTAKIEAYTVTITDAWDVLIDAAENARRDLDLEERIQTYIEDEYLDKDDSGLQFKTNAKEQAYDDLADDLPALKNTADALGMDESVTLTDFDNKSMTTLKSEWDTAIEEQATAYTEW